MGEYVDRVDHLQSREAVRADSGRFSFVYDCDCLLLNRIGDRCGLSIVERVRCATDDKTLEVARRRLVQLDDRNEASGDEIVQEVGIPATPGPPELKLARDDIDNDYAVREGLEDRSRATRG